MERIVVKIKKLNKERADQFPSYATPGSAGVDLHAALDSDLILEPGQIQRIPTGIAIELPNANVGAFIFARSGLSTKYGLTLVNGVGVVDSDYRGEIQVAMINLGSENVTIHDGERIAQMVFMPVFIADFQPVEELNSSTRGEKGFGSTGL